MPYGIEAVISHVFPNGEERPIAFSSRTLSKAEKNYGQIDKEALSLVFGIQKFHKYLYGCKFVLVTDHKPLITLFGPKKGIPSLAAARLQRWALLLSAYSYDIQFRRTEDHSNADALSRLPLSVNNVSTTTYLTDTFMIGQLQALPVSAEQVATVTRRDTVLSKVYNYVQKGWPQTVKDDEKPYWRRAKELSTQSGCLLWGNRVIIPGPLRNKLIDELHQNHPGIGMKSIARSYFWWPALDRELEEKARSCVACQSVKNSSASAPLHPWLWPAKPWQRVHIDFAGPFMNRTFLIVVDDHSKWPEVIKMHSITAQKTITELRKL